MGGDEAKELYQHFYKKVQEGYSADRVKDGVFQAMMEVALVNDGPVSVGIREDKTALLTLHEVTLEMSVTPNRNSK
jgi:hypothetical protein